MNVSAEQEPQPFSHRFDINFDIDQVGPRLSWQCLTFYTDGSWRNGYQTVGQNNGAVLLHRGLKVDMTLRGLCSRDTNNQIGTVEIAQAILITLPRVPTARFASPFGAAGSAAAIVFGVGAFVPGVIQSPASEVVLNLRTPIDVCADGGRWEMSMVISVSYTPPGANTTPELRVFRFDPEVQIGNGTEPGIAEPPLAGR